METNKKSTLHLLEYLYTTTNNLEIEYRALSYKELNILETKYKVKRNTLQTEIVKLALLESVTFHYLNTTDISTLYKLIMDQSIITIKEIDEIDIGLDIILDDMFSDDNFKSCSLCQSRGLDKQRNCPLLDKDTHDKAVFYIVGNRKLEECPMDGVHNNYIIADALSAYNIYESGFLPTEGGILDQTIFFNQVAPRVKSKINKNTANNT